MSRCSAVARIFAGTDSRGSAGEHRVQAVGVAGAVVDGHPQVVAPQGRSPDGTAVASFTRVIPIWAHIWPTVIAGPGMTGRRRDEFLLAVLEVLVEHPEACPAVTCSPRWSRARAHGNSPTRALPHRTHARQPGRVRSRGIPPLHQWRPVIQRWRPTIAGRFVCVTLRRGRRRSPRRLSAGAGSTGGVPRPSARSARCTRRRAAADPRSGWADGSWWLLNRRSPEPDTVASTLAPWTARLPAVLGDDGSSHRPPSPALSTATRRPPAARAALAHGSGDLGHRHTHRLRHRLPQLSGRQRVLSGSCCARRGISNTQPPCTSA